MTVAIKYCGGCNPQYNRTALVNRLREEFPQLEFIGPDADFPDFVLVVCGCPSRCANHGNLHGTLGKLVLFSQDQFAIVKQVLYGILTRS